MSHRASSVFGCSHVLEWADVSVRVCVRLVTHTPPTYTHTHQHQAPPTGGPLKALIFDSYYDAYRGVVVYFRVMDGEIRPKVRRHERESGCMNGCRSMQAWHVRPPTCACV